MSASSLSSLEKGVLAGLVADAASLSVHWHYDTKKLRTTLGNSVKTPEFFQPMDTQFYTAKDFPGHYSLGQLSCYGEQTIMMMDYFKESKGNFEGGEKFAQFMLNWFKNYTGRIDHPTNEFMGNADELIEDEEPLFPAAGADDVQTMFTFKIPVIAMKMLNGPEKDYFQVCEEATRAHQNTDICSKYAKVFATILKLAHEGKSFENIVDLILASDEFQEDVKDSIRFSWDKRAVAKPEADGWDSALEQFSTDASKWLFERDQVANEKFKAVIALTCAYPGSFMCAIKLIADTVETLPAADFKDKAFELTIRRNICMGGDNCGRTMVLGSVLVALGAEIPQSFMDQYADLDKSIELITTVSQM